MNKQAWRDNFSTAELKLIDFASHIISHYPVLADSSPYYRIIGTLVILFNQRTAGALSDGWQSINFDHNDHQILKLSMQYAKELKAGAIEHDALMIIAKMTGVLTGQRTEIPKKGNSDGTQKAKQAAS